jgi:flagellin
MREKFLSPLNGGVAMRIRSSWTSLRTVRAFSGAVAAGDVNLSRLSSGLRVRGAADDAAGLGIAQRLRAQYMGLMRANRNAMDGLSLTNTAESAMQEVSTILQRLRELAIRAGNGVWDAQDLAMMQGETNELLKEIDRIADSAKFNGQDLLSVGGNSAALASVMNGLQGGWLEQAANLIQTYYGISGDGSPLQVIFESSGPSPTWVTGTPGAGGKLDNLAIHINLSQFESGGPPDGGNGPVYHDRKIARALTEAIIARNANFTNLSNDYWFISGAASLISGGDEELQAAVTQYGAAAVVNALSTPWVNDNLHQAAAYLAVKYLNATIPGAMPVIFADLSAGAIDLSSAIATATGAPLGVFLANFAANGAAFLGTLNLSDPDVGGINPGDAIGVVPNGGTYSTNPLFPAFDIKMSVAGNLQPIQFNLQVGSNNGDSLKIEYAQINTFSLGLIGINLATNAGQAIQLYDAAINQVSTARAQLGAAANRLESILKTNGWGSEGQLRGYSQILDLDMAQEMSDLTKNQILRDASAAMMAYVNAATENMVTILQATPTLFDLSPDQTKPAHTIGMQSR